MAFVIDASATLPWRFEDEATPWTEALLERIERGEHVLVPAHWPLEVLNALTMAQRRNRLSGDHVREFVDDLAALPIHVEPARPPSEWQLVLNLAEKYRLTLYDAAYLGCDTAKSASTRYA
ncbi:MAG: type II toxin-antitoxin system VapC family toxin [Acidobacteriia bacterium]|nr:type II toxin-antitoxin system VapC family toxin [Terriglobia bacterium]